MTIADFIKKKAEGRWPYHLLPLTEQDAAENMFIELKKEGYIIGATEWVETMKDFAEWVNGLYLRIEGDDEGNEWKERLLDKYYNTDQLLSEYIKTFKNG